MGEGRGNCTFGLLLLHYRRHGFFRAGEFGAGLLNSHTQTLISSLSLSFHQAMRSFCPGINAAFFWWLFVRGVFGAVFDGGLSFLGYGLWVVDCACVVRACVR